MDSKLKISGLGKADPSLLLMGKGDAAQGLAARALDAGANGDEKKTLEAAKQFEGLLLEQMFKSMWSTLPADQQLLGSQEEEYFRDMFNQALAESVSEGQGIGIRDVVMKEMKNKSKE